MIELTLRLSEAWFRLRTEKLCISLTACELIFGEENNTNLFGTSWMLDLVCILVLEIASETGARSFFGLCSLGDRDLSLNGFDDIETSVNSVHEPGLLVLAEPIWLKLGLASSSFSPVCEGNFFKEPDCPLSSPFCHPETLILNNCSFLLQTSVMCFSDAGDRKAFSNCTSNLTFEAAK